VIKIQATWVLPSNTRIIGEGRQTDLRATSTFTPDSSSPVEAMVEMGNANVCSSGCTGISIEHLKIDGSNNLIVPPSNVGLTGIYNNYAQDSSYVDDVNLYDIGAVSYTQSTLTTGLLIGPGAAGSGPYSNINFAGSAICSCAHSQSNCTCTPTACVQIEAQTRGLHGITCSGASDQTPGDGPWAGIYLDASNNTIEDVHNEAFYDAIVVGDNADGLNATVAGNVISNVSGGYGGTGPTTNTIHICNPSYGSQTGACSATSDHITDLGIFQANSSGGYKNGVTGYHATTIEDDLTGTTINSNAYPTYVGTYILGELVGTSQYSRFTTSLGSTNGSSVTVPTWAVGSTVLTGLSCTTPGAIYSNTKGSGHGTGSSNTLYLCSGDNWLPIENQ